MRREYCLQLASARADVEAGKPSHGNDPSSGISVSKLSESYVWPYEASNDPSRELVVLYILSTVKMHPQSSNEFSTDVLLAGFPNS